jgi:AcrR family transcriptional regulator
MTSRALQAKQTRAKLLRGAAKLFDQYGFDNVTVKDISKKAGVSVGAFYHYYDSKTEIYTELYRRIDVYFREEVAPLLTGEDVTEDILIFFRHYAKYNAERGFRHVRLLFETHSELFTDKTRYFHVLFRQLIERGRASGQLDGACEEGLIENCIMVMARGIVYDWILDRGAFDLKERMGEYMRILIGTFRG